eukprot:1162154-Pelagomonas_calceolata.AAC.13
MISTQGGLRRATSMGRTMFAVSILMLKSRMRSRCMNSRYKPCIMALHKDLGQRGRRPYKAVRGTRVGRRDKNDVLHSELYNLPNIEGGKEKTKRERNG